MEGAEVPANFESSVRVIYTLEFQWLIYLSISLIRAQGGMNVDEVNFLGQNCIIQFPIDWFVWYHLSIDVKITWSTYLIRN